VGPLSLSLPMNLGSTDGPLSPTLSPSEGERENHPQLPGESRFRGRVPARAGEGPPANSPRFHG